MQAAITEAAPRIWPSQRAVLRTLACCGKMTDAELATTLGWTINRITPRRGELVKLGLVAAKGQKKSAHDRQAVIWQCTQTGLSNLKNQRNETA
jgi:DNA-binding MarR family transcriptional regulator